MLEGNIVLFHGITPYSDSKLYQEFDEILRELRQSWHPVSLWMKNRQILESTSYSLRQLQSEQLSISFDAKTYKQISKEDIPFLKTKSWHPFSMRHVFCHFLP